MDSMFKHVWLDFNDAEVRTSVLFNRPCCVMNFNCLRLMLEVRVEFGSFVAVTK